MNPSFFNFKVFVLPEGEAKAPEGRGANKKGLLIVYETGNEPADALDSFLAKILQAVNYDLQEDAYTIQKTPQTALSLEPWMEEHTVHHVLLFGVQPAAVGLAGSPERYTPVRTTDRTLLLADPLATIYRERQEGGKDRSVKLWNALKQIFLSN